ncbi:MAG: hypothetical protein ABW171_18540 [Steroidobacter sp.]
MDFAEPVTISGRLLDPSQETGRAASRELNRQSRTQLGEILRKIRALSRPCDRFLAYNPRPENSVSASGDQRFVNP